MRNWPSASACFSGARRGALTQRSPGSQAMACHLASSLCSPRIRRSMMASGTTRRKISITPITSRPNSHSMGSLLSGIGYLPHGARGPAMVPQCLVLLAPRNTCSLSLYHTIDKSQYPNLRFLQTFVAKSTTDAISVTLRYEFRTISAPWTLVPSFPFAPSPDRSACPRTTAWPSFRNSYPLHGAEFDDIGYTGYNLYKQSPPGGEGHCTIVSFRKLRRDAGWSVRQIAAVACIPPQFLRGSAQGGVCD